MESIRYTHSATGHISKAVQHDVFYWGPSQCSGVIMKVPFESSKCQEMLVKVTLQSQGGEITVRIMSELGYTQHNHSPRCCITHMPPL